MITMGAQGVLGVVLIAPRQRCAVSAIADALAMVLFTGSAPLLASWLLERQHWPWALPLDALVHGPLALWAMRSSRALLR